MERLKSVCRVLPRLVVNVGVAVVKHPVKCLIFLSLFPEHTRALRLSIPIATPTDLVEPSENPLWEYFQSNKTGRGIWKWTHYFDAYHKHLHRFRNKKLNLIEVGVYSGGSLPMWRRYFGDACHIIGVDIESACKAYASDEVDIVIGDQGDPSFWKSLRQQYPLVDILIDDGGHTPEQQMVTLECMLPHLSPGGVYIVEDIHGISNRFCGFALGLIRRLNAMQYDGRPGVFASDIQRTVHSIHFYPFMMVVEKRQIACERLVAPKHGTEWEPFL